MATRPVETMYLILVLSSEYFGRNFQQNRKEKASGDTSKILTAPSRKSCPTVKTFWFTPKDVLKRVLFAINFCFLSAFVLATFFSLFSELAHFAMERKGCGACFWCVYSRGMTFQ